MTLIVAFEVNGWPVVVGDLLLSGPESQRTPVHIPTIGDTEQVFPSGSGWTIAGLSQKIIRITDYCVVGWSGNKIVATMLIKELKVLSRSARITLELIEESIGALDESAEKLGIALAGWVHNEQGFIGFQFGGYSVDCASLGRAFVIGSGAETFVEVMKGHPVTMPDANRRLNRIEATVARALSITGSLLAAESVSAETLLNYFGGGYEIATFGRSKFHKIGEITYILWHVALSDRGITIDQPYYVAKQEYEGDVLVIRSGRIRDAARRTKFGDSIFAVFPVDHRNKDFDARGLLPDLNSRFTCHYLIVGSTGLVRTRIEYSPDSASNSILFTDRVGGEVVFSVNKQFIKRSGDEISRELRSVGF